MIEDKVFGAESGHCGNFFNGERRVIYAPSVELLSAVTVKECDSSTVHERVYCFLPEILYLVNNDEITSFGVVFPMVPVVDEGWAYSDGSKGFFHIRFERFAEYNDLQRSSIVGNNIVRLPEGKNRFAAPGAPLYDERFPDFLIENLTLEIVKFGFPYIKTSLAHFDIPSVVQVIVLDVVIRGLLEKRSFRRCFQVAKNKELDLMRNTESGDLSSMELAVSMERLRRMLSI